MEARRGRDKCNAGSMRSTTARPGSPGDARTRLDGVKKDMATLTAGDMRQGHVTITLRNLGTNTPHTTSRISMPLRYLLLTAVLVPLAVVSAEPMPPVQQLQVARTQVQKWMKAHEQERASLVEAYAKKDVAKLERLAMQMERQPGLPGGEALMRDEFAPFLKCDTAQRDLSLLASAMAQHAARGTPGLQKMVAAEQADYERTSALCKGRLSMTPTAAWDAYQAE